MLFMFQFFLISIALARMDLISFRRKEWSWGEVKQLPLPPARGLPSGFPMVRIAGSWQEHFQNGNDGDKKRESNGAILSYIG